MVGKTVIIGAGAAGLMAAGVLAAAKMPVAVVEHMDAPGKKLLITGKGRCNLTSNCTRDEFLLEVRSNPKFLFAALSALSPQDTMALFERLDVPLKTERGARVFPESNRAADVRDALVRWAGDAQFVRGRAVQIETKDGQVTGVALEGGRTLEADAVIVATGGKSYPLTGSTGDGYKLAAALGHTIVPPEPSLVPLLVEGPECPALMGLSLRNVKLSLLEGEKKKPLYEEQGEMLFAHFGLTGPLVLSASAHLKKGKTHTVSIDLKPALSEEKLYARIGRDFEKHGAKEAKNALVDLLPGKLIPIILARWGVDPEQRASQLPKEQRLALARLLKDLRFPVAGKGPFAHAVVTAGGVSVKEVDPSTMESKKVWGLYFAGEVLDLDAYTGGFNLQIAFSTGYLAAQSIVKRSKT